MDCSGVVKNKTHTRLRSYVGVRGGGFNARALHCLNCPLSSLFFFFFAFRTYKPRMYVRSALHTPTPTWLEIVLLLSLSLYDSLGLLFSPLVACAAMKREGVLCTAGPITSSCMYCLLHSSFYSKQLYAAL